jgi:hypothetical protein
VAPTRCLATPGHPLDRSRAGGDLPLTVGAIRSRTTLLILISRASPRTGLQQADWLLDRMAIVAYEFHETPLSRASRGGLPMAESLGEAIEVYREAHDAWRESLGTDIEE